jgi:uncharacterized membrane protein YeaQ/YmgE (transglycosylase-associated protein family)
MGIVAWILLGLASGLLASRLLPGGKARGLALPCVIGTCGALLGGWAATSLLHRQVVNGFFSLPAWLTALLGAAILLLAYHTITGHPGEPGQTGKGTPVPIPVRRRDSSP